MALGFLLGGLWYSPALFAKAWQRAAGLSDEQAKSGNMAMIFGLTFVLSLIAAYVFGMFLGNSMPLAGALAEDEEISRHLDRAALARLCDPANYLGQAGTMVDRVLEHRVVGQRLSAECDRGALPERGDRDVERAEQGVAYSHFVWAIISTKEHVRAFVQREGLSESAMELHGELELLHLLGQFFEACRAHDGIGNGSAIGTTMKVAVGTGYFYFDITQST